MSKKDRIEPELSVYDYTQQQAREFNQDAPVSEPIEGAATYTRLQIEAMGGRYVEQEVKGQLRSFLIDAETGQHTTIAKLVEKNRLITEMAQMRHDLLVTSHELGHLHADRDYWQKEAGSETKRAVAALKRADRADCWAIVSWFITVILLLILLCHRLFGA